MKCKRCNHGPIEFIYRVNWCDIYYCPECDLEHRVDLRNQLELVDHDLRLKEEFGQ